MFVKNVCWWNSLLTKKYLVLHSQKELFISHLMAKTIRSSWKNTIMAQWFYQYEGERHRRDTYSWKKQLERTKSWKVLNWKGWSWKISLKLERPKRSLKEPSEVGKNRLKLKSDLWSCKATIELEKINRNW